MNDFTAKKGTHNFQHDFVYFQVLLYNISNVSGPLCCACERCPFSLHRLILLCITPLGVKCLRYHSSACNIMCCACAISPRRRKFVKSRTEMRCLLFETLRTSMITTILTFCDAFWWMEDGILLSKLPLVLHLWYVTRNSHDILLEGQLRLIVLETWLVASEHTTLRHRVGWVQKPRKVSNFSMWALVSWWFCEEL